MGNLQGKLLKNKNGLMLIEVILSMGLIMVVISMIIPLFLRLNNIYKATVDYDRNYFYAQEALLYIKNEMIQNTLNCNIDNNKIKINKLDGTRKEVYRAKGTNNLFDIIVTYYSNNYASATNNILKSVKDFQIIKKDKLIYLYIITSDGKKYERCWPLNL